jgi:predicted ATPase/class 3 adenylate cyclase
MSTGERTDLPTGTVTFLFTDIEGSTRLVQRLADQYAEVLGDHCRIMREAIRDAGGVEVGTEGDSFFAVFRDAKAGIEAAVAAQRGMEEHDWPGSSEVRVRMGLHTGIGTLGGDNYLGLDVHRAARIAAAGHGGQVLLSDSTRSLVEGSLPPDARLRELGAHRLKDLANPERLFQLEAPGLASDFPALRTLDARANNLPVQLTSFVGREAEIAAIGGLLERTPLVTLTGPGGTGKTRLAIQVAAERLTSYADGAFLVELAPILDPGLVPSAIAAALRVHEAPDRPLVDTLKEELRDRQVLLVLDNFEHVTGAAGIVTELLARAPRLRILVTSRAVLHVRGEHEFPLAPLRVPDPTNLPPIDALSQYEGVALFVERAVATRPDFAISATSAPAIAEIVARLDGLPLAIELAAAKTKLLGAEAILARLDSRLAFLGGGPRDLPARQQTLRQAIDWSYSLLSPDDQRFMSRLAVFVGGWNADAADAVLGRDPNREALEGLGILVDQSLVRRDEGAHGEPRFALLETIREYALERLVERAEADVFRRRHAVHFTAVAEATEPELAKSPAAGDQIARDHDNFRAALAWTIEAGETDIGLRLGYALWRFWQQRAHLREGREWFERLLALPGAKDRNTARAKGLTGAAGIAYWQNDYGAASAWYAEAEEIIRDRDDPVWLADALYNSGTVAALTGDMAGVTAKLAEGLAIGRRVGDDGIIGRFLGAMGYMAFMGDDLPRARDLLEQTLAAAERAGERLPTAQAHHMVAQVARLEGRFDEAAEHYRQAVRFGHELGDAASLTEPLQGLAAVAILTGETELGVHLLGANDAIRERLGGGPPPEWLRLGDPLAEARHKLGAEAYERAWALGRSMSVDEAVAAVVDATKAPDSGR